MIRSLSQFTRARLIHLRWLSVAGMLAAALISEQLLSTADLVFKLSAYAASVGMVNAALTGALHTLREGRLKNVLLAPMSQLSLDLLLWSGYVYLSGGASNPLISIFLPLVAFGAVVLSNKQAWTLGIASIVLYSILWKFHVPTPMADGMDHAQMHDSSSQHLFGMWVVFVVSAVVLLWFILRMSQEIRDRDAALNEAKEKAIRNDWLISMGSLAAGAAHEMSTPLATLNILMDEWRENQQNLPDHLRSDVDLIQRQIDVCKRALNQLTQRAGHARNIVDTESKAIEWLKPLFDGWTSLHPHITLVQRIDPDILVGSIAYDMALERVLTNLLDNAMQAGATQLSVDVSAMDGSLKVQIDDNGRGISHEALEAFSKYQPIESEAGMGIGLLLSRSTLEQLGGSLTMQLIPARGTRATLVVGLHASRAAT